MRCSGWGVETEEAAPRTCTQRRFISLIMNTPPDKNVLRWTNQIRFFDFFFFPPADPSTIYCTACSHGGKKEKLENALGDSFN